MNWKYPDKAYVDKYYRQENSMLALQCGQKYELTAKEACARIDFETTELKTSINIYELGRLKWKVVSPV